MSGEPQLFRVDPQSRESERIEEVDFRQLGFQERRDIQEWVAANPDILGEDLLIISKEFSGFDRTNERLDLLAVDPYGKLVVIELKRDDTGANAHWQAIKYASYLQHATAEQIAAMLSDYKKAPPEDAWEELVQHLGGDDLNTLNNDQRIILASHRFAPEVTSAAVWLNSKAQCEDLITCITLTPYRDANTDSLYLQATTIIPVPGMEDYVVGIGGNSKHTASLKRKAQRNRDDEITAFARKVGQLALQGLPDNVRPNKRSRWAEGSPDVRHYRLWYSRDPWRKADLYYAITFRPVEGEPEHRWVNVRFRDDRNLAMSALNGIKLGEQQEVDHMGIYVRMGGDTLNDDFAGRIAEMLRHFIQKITPIVDNLEDENNEEEA